MSARETSSNAAAGGRTCALPRGYRDIQKEAIAAKSLVESFRAQAGDDDELLADMVEGETELFEAIDRLLQRMLDTRVMVTGIERAEEQLFERRRRFEKRVEADKALIEQALMVADINTKVERPLATFFLSKRQPKVEISTEADIPAEFWKAADPVLDKKALLDALKADQVVPGACLSNAAPTLTVRFS